MDIGLRKFIGEHSDLFAEAGRALRRAGPSEGCVYVELDDQRQELGAVVRCSPMCTAS